MKNILQHKLALFLLLGLLASGIYYFFLRGVMQKGRSSNGKIASLVEKNNSVRVKVKGELNWFESKGEEGLGHGDSVYTESESTAVIKFAKKNNSINLGPRTLIVIENEEEEANLLEGMIFLDNKKTAPEEINIKVNGKSITLSTTQSSRALITAEGKVASIKGVTTIKQGKESVKIQEGQILDRESKKVRPLEQKEIELFTKAQAPTPVQKPRKISLLYPKDESSLPITHASATLLQFRWDANFDDNYNLSISKDPSHNQNLLKTSVRAKEFSWMPKSFGIFYWTVCDNQNRNCSTQSFAISPGSPQWFQPETTPVSWKIYEPTAYEFTWSDVYPNGETVTANERESQFNYVVEISTRPNFEQIIQTQQVKGNKLAVKFDQLGDYFVRVRAKSPGHDGPWSEARELVVSKNDPLPAPLVPDNYEIYLDPNEVSFGPSLVQ